jgi:hypothetical protein
MLLALAFVLVVALNRSPADYLVIKVDVNKNYFQAATAGPAGMVPGMMPGMNEGRGGPMAQPMAPLGRGSPMGPMGPTGPMGQTRPQGIYSQRPYPNQPRGQAPAAPGPMAPQGAKGGKGGAPMQPDQAADDDEEHTPRYVYAYVEVRLHKKDPWYMNFMRQRTHLTIDHPWGRDCRIPVEMLKLPYSDKELEVIHRATVAKEYEALYKAKVKDGRNPRAMLHLARWALGHGLLKQFHDLMEELKVADGVPADVKSAVAMHQKTKEALKKPPTAEDPAVASLMADLKAEGYRQTISVRGRYSMLSNLPENRQDDIRRRLALMDETYEKFYYWFALHSAETMPPLPNRRLLAVLVANPKEFRSKHAIWGSLPLVCDGFLPRRDNVMILSAEHLDEAYAILKKNNKAHTKFVSMDELLSGSVWSGRRGKEAHAHFYNVATLQTLVMVQKALEEEAERATISHEATRQLLFATGLLPRNVDVPEWVQYGLSSFFETPQGAFYPGVGLPSWSNLVNFKYHRRKNHLGSPKDTLLQVISDAYFHRARESASLFADNRDNEQMEETAKEDEEIARATAWGLVYHLAREDKLNLLIRYSQELDRLPRDLELGKRVLQGCFTRAFDLREPSRFQGWADSWFSEMENYALEIPRYEYDLINARLEAPAHGAAPKTAPARGAPGTVTTPPGLPGTATTPPGFPGQGTVTTPPGQGTVAEPPGFGKKQKN